jgi:bloom syndrome protein
MSINNLADQLKWLLTSRTFLPPPAPTPTSTVEELPDGFGEDDTLNSFEDSAAEERQDAKLPKDIVARDTLLQAISYDTLENNPDMARLRTPASPAHRPPLQDIPSVEEMCEHPRTSRSRYFSPVAEQENRDPHGVTQTKSVSSHPVSAPRPQVSRGESRNQLRASSPSKPVPNSIHPQNRHILIPILDTIDLTEDDETFAPQNPKINTVSYPDLDPARSSRKRKSEDYEADLHVKSKRFNSPVKVATPPITQSIEQSPHRKPQPQTIQVFKQDVDDTRYFSESSDAHEDESLVLLGHNSLRKPSVSIKTTKLPPLETHNYDQSPSPVRQASVKEEWKSSVVKEQPPPANDLAHAKHAIADSEDEEALEVMMELEQEDVTMEDTIKTGLEEISEKHESPPLPSIPDSQRQKDRASVHMSQPASNLIQSPAFLPREARIGNTQPALGTTDHNGILEVFKTTNDTVKQLALFTMADIDEYKLFLQAEHTQAINAATQAFCDGEDLSGFQAEKRRLQAQLQACDVLLDLWNAQCLLSARHTMLKQKIMKAVEADLDPDPALAVAVKALRQEIAEGEQGLTQQVNRSGFDVNSKEPLVEEPKSTYKVAVKGTQLPTRTPHEDFSSSSRTVFGTQAIKQTQAPVPRSREIFEHPAPMRDTYNRPKSPSRRVQPARHDRESYVPTFAQDPRPMANNNGQSRFQNYGDRQEVRRVESTSYHDLIDDADDFDDVDEMEMSNVMGTPPNRNAADDDNDDFGFDDDEEMLEVADDLDMRPTKNQKDRSTKVREVLPAASANPRTKHVALPGVRNKEKVSLPPLDIKDDDHRWSKDMKSALKKVFKLSGFRPNQQAAINATLGGKDVFVLMPTGGGKSLCYQLPAVVKTGRTRGVTIVVSPLLSLMEDQVSHLQSLGVQAMMINSSSSPDEKKLIMNALRGPDPETFIQLLYVTPEMLSKNLGLVEILKNLHRNKKFARIVIDEAHCVSQWGHDFRPDYKALGEVRRQFVGVPVIALTATATENVKLDVISNLGIDGCEVFMQSFNRPNLIYEVRPKKPKMILSEMAEIIAQDYDGETGIIYCLARKKCEEVAEQLQKQHNIRAMHYHADMSPDEKSRVQHAWQSGEYQVIVATIAFGMGIDKGNVRFVMHHTLPKSLEGYYQETGRAGRDGKQSGCYLFYSYADCSTLKRMIEDGDGSYDQKQRQKQMLRRVVQFCENRIDCRRVQVLSYFNETFTSEACHKSCDNCNSMSIFEEQDFTSQATDAIKFVEAVLQKSRQDVRDSHQSDKNEKRFTLLQLVDMFRGVKKDYNEDIELHGVGSELSKTTAERLFQRLLTDEALQELNVLNKGGFASQYIRVWHSQSRFIDTAANPFDSSANQHNNSLTGDAKSSSRFASPPVLCKQARLARRRQQR